MFEIDVCGQFVALLVCNTLYSDVSVIIRPDYLVESTEP